MDAVWFGLSFFYGVIGLTTSFVLDSSYRDKRKRRDGKWTWSEVAVASLAWPATLGVFLSLGTKRLCCRLLAPGKPRIPRARLTRGRK